MASSFLWCMHPARFVYELSEYHFQGLNTHFLLQAVAAMQPGGPLLLMGCSIAGCAIASAMADALERMHRQPLLLLLDGCAAPPQEVTLHEPTWCDAHPS